MNPNKKKLIIIGGCSGGGKSTLLDELGSHGYSIVPEVARQIVRDELKRGGSITPWQNPQLFCETMVEKSIETYYQALELPSQVIFFDRSFLDGVSYYEILNKKENDIYNSFITTLKFYPKVFMTPPWEEIYCQDDERKHPFAKAVKEYRRLIKFYPRWGYEVVELPKVSVRERLEFILSNIGDYNE